MNKVDNICKFISILVGTPFMIWLSIISWKIALCFFMILWMNNLKMDSYKKEED